MSKTEVLALVLGCAAVLLLTLASAALPQQTLVAQGPDPITNCTAPACDNGCGGCTTTCAGKRCDPNDTNKFCTTTASGCSCQ